MITIRPAGRGDIPALVAIDPLTLSDTGRRQAIAQWAAAGKCFLALRGDAPVGYVALTQAFFHQPFVELLIVAQAARRSGVGLALLGHCIEQTPVGDKLWSTTNRSNLAMQGLLAKGGFMLSGTIENLDEGDPELVFLLRRPASTAA
jgi:ribosomal protein S18 acetylase RimI-like enzyme